MEDQLHAQRLQRGLVALQLGLVVQHGGRDLLPFATCVEQTRRGKFKLAELQKAGVGLWCTFVDFSTARLKVKNESPLVARSIFYETTRKTEHLRHVISPSDITGHHTYAFRTFFFEIVDECGGPGGFGAASGGQHQVADAVVAYEVPGGLAAPSGVPRPKSPSSTA